MSILARITAVPDFSKKNMLTLKRTSSDNADFKTLVRLLDLDLAERYGASQSFFDRFNKVDLIREVVVAYLEDAPVGCGAIKPFANQVMEIKRMFTLDRVRGRGVATAIIGELEQWVVELGCTRCVLETGTGQPEAIRFYEKIGYIPIPNYGPYAEVAVSRCFEKQL